MSRILVIDDESEYRGVICQILENEGHKVLQADDGTDGYDLAVQELPDLVICDVHMEKMNGFMVHERLRETPATRWFL